MHVMTAPGHPDAFAPGGQGLVPLPQAVQLAGHAEQRVDDADPIALGARGLLALGALYIPAAIVLGYPLALFLLLVAVALYEGKRFSWRMAAVAGGGAAFFYVLFELVLGVRQPEGLLF